jgi:heme/copper-type cytochrome/quinol oxidase subunit 2
MAQFFHIIIHILFFVLFLFIVLMANYLLKPLRKNKKRPVSTMFLKASYMSYLITILVLLYFILFFFEAATEHSKPHINNYYFLTCIIIPNVAIFVRRHINARITYNYFFGIFNLLTMAYLLRQLLTIDWVFSLN